MTARGECKLTAFIHFVVPVCFSAAGFFLLCHDRGVIKADQPTIFGSKLIVALSSVQDGNMRKGIGESDEIIDENRRKFLSREMIAMPATILCGVTYDGDDFTRYVEVRSPDKGKGMIPDTEMITADGIATSETRIALFLPLADCTGAVLYDSKQLVLMVSHLGRHSNEQYGARKSVEFMKDKFGTKPEHILAWLSPAPNGDDYPLWKRDNMSSHDVVRNDLESAGIVPQNIQASSVDTVKDQNYFSHSEFLRGNRETDGRYAIVAMMR